MAQSFGIKSTGQTQVAAFTSARSLLLISSGVVRKFEMESMLTKLRKRMMKWGMPAAKVGLAAFILVVAAVSTQTSELDGFDGLNFGALFQRGLERSSFVWVGIGTSMKKSATPTTGNSRTPTRNDPKQVRLGEGPKCGYVTLNAANMADMIAVFPSVSVTRFNPAIQRMTLSDGSMARCRSSTITQRTT